MPASTADKLPPTADPRCGTSAGYQAHTARGEAACARCREARALAMRVYRESASYREAQRQSARLSDANGRARRYAATHDRNLQSRQARSRYSARSHAQADADFARLNPEGVKACRGCGELLPMDAFARMMAVADGRQRYCSRNRCASDRRFLSRDQQLAAYWTDRGIDPAVCIYCRAEPATDLEHVMPKALGGSDDFENLAPACPTCNRGVGGKFDTHPVTWLTAAHPERLSAIVALFPHIMEVARA